MADAPATNDAEGHRARVRERLLAGGGDALADYELIEYLLTLAMRRGDTKATAKALLREFGGLGKVLCAEPEALMQVHGVGEVAAAALKIAQATAVALLREEAMSRPLLASWEALLDYLRADMGYLTVERVRVLYLDSKNMLISDDVMSEGTLDQAALYVREVIKRAMALGSANLILVHNHPSGDSQPSRADIQLTRDMIEAGKRLGISVHDHVIIGLHGHTSLRAQGLI
jgi:DNA repair protein RadC